MRDEPTNNLNASQDDVDELRWRIEQLERDNARLRRQAEEVFGPDNPDFDPVVFQCVLQRYNLIVPLLMAVVLVPLLLAAKFWGPFYIGPVPLLDFGGAATGHPGFGLGVVAFGGLAVGVVAAGGCACGIIAFGGGSFGIIAIGGGSVGLIALGGGAVGYIAIGGSTFGRYALGNRAYGKAAFGINRQDPEAVRFFTKHLTRLRAAIQEPPASSVSQ